MEIGAYARERWEQGDRDEKEVAASYLREVLAGPDPFQVLFQPVYARFSDEFRRLRKVLEREVGAWDRDPEDPAVHVPGDSQTSNGGSEGGTSPVQRRDESHVNSGRGGTAFDKRLLLREQLVFVIGKGKIEWHDVTLADIDATIEHYEGIVAGHKKSIAFLESAKRLMIAHDVECLGDVPFDEVSGILPDAA